MCIRDRFTRARYELAASHSSCDIVAKHIARFVGHAKLPTPRVMLSLPKGNDPVEAKASSPPPLEVTAASLYWANMMRTLCPCCRSERRLSYGIRTILI